MKINALLVTDDIRNYSIKLLKAYVATLGLRYVVFQQNNKFTGWMNSGPFVAQLPADPEDKMTIPFANLADLKGINKHSVKPGASAKEVLEKMQEPKEPARKNHAAIANTPTPSQCQMPLPDSTADRYLRTIQNQLIKRIRQRDIDYELWDAFVDLVERG